MQRIISSALVAVCLSPFATAQHLSDFEMVNGSATGVDLNKQLGYYLPSTGGVSFKAYLGAVKPLGIPLNPTGGAYMVAATGLSASTYARSERLVAYCGNKFTAVCDVLVKVNGTLTAAANSNIGSVSQQPSPTSKHCIMLARWDTVGTTPTWKASMGYFTAAAPTTTTLGDPVTKGFTGLKTNTWYHWETDFDLKTNLITEIRLTDIVAKTTVKDTPVGWYLNGGPNSTMLRPVAMRMFAVLNPTTANGNLIAFDNVGMLFNGAKPVKGLATVYGSGTGRPNPKGSLTFTGVPTIDSTVTIGLNNPLGTQTKGAATQLWLGVAKLDPGPMIPGFGMSVTGGGELLINPLTFVPGPAWSGSGPADFVIPIPAECSLKGVVGYLQGVMIQAGAKAPVALTEAVAVTVGNAK